MIGAMLIELGIPLVLIAMLFVAPKLRPFSYSVLGAVTPFLFAYISVLTSTPDSADAANKWASDAIWAMSFVGYAIAVLVGIALGLTSRPKHSTLRFVTSSVVSLGVVWLVLTLA